MNLLSRRNSGWRGPEGLAAIEHLGANGVPTVRVNPGGHGFSVQGTCIESCNGPGVRCVGLTAPEVGPGMSWERFSGPRVEIVNCSDPRIFPIHGTGAMRGPDVVER